MLPKRNSLYKDTNQIKGQKKIHHANANKRNVEWQIYYQNLFHSKDYYQE